MLSEQELRKSIIEKRKRFTIDVKQYNLINGLITKNVKALVERFSPRAVMLYLPINGEVDITGITEIPIKFYVPVTHGVDIRPAEYTPDTPMKAGEFGVSVPADPVYTDKNNIDLVIVPAVAVDRQKNRIGYGKGCYDRFLADMDCIKAAVCFNFQVVDELMPKPHDIKMDYIITESGCF